MDRSQRYQSGKMHRRQFGMTMGASAGGLMLGSTITQAAAAGVPARKAAFIRGAFTYPPTETLRKASYYSWPGSSFDAEGRQAQYEKILEQFAQESGMRIEMDEQPLDSADSVARFIQSVKQSQPDGLLLIPFKKSHFDNVVKILDKVKIPAVVMASMGILLNVHVQTLHTQPGVYLINSLDNLDAVKSGLRMIQAGHGMKVSRIINIDGQERKESTVPVLGTQVRTIPHLVFYDEFARMTRSSEVTDLANSYLKNAVKRVEPSEDDVLEAAKTYFVLKKIVAAEEADAVMMNCLPGLQVPHKHVPPCMGYMNLRNEGIPAGCESDLDATLSMLLIQYLFGQPAFQHNPSMDTEKNHYFGAHCTCASKMHGPNSPAEAYILRSHAEAGWGCVPQVLFPAGQGVTFTKYLSGQNPPQMLVYSGVIAGCPSNPPCGGCRTNVELELDEVEDACTVKGHHLCLFYGKHAKDLRTFCQLYGIQAVA